MPSLTHLVPLLDLENFLDESQSLSNSYARKICGAFCLYKTPWGSVVAIV